MLRGIKKIRCGRIPREYSTTSDYPSTGPRPPQGALRLVFRYYTGFADSAIPASQPAIIRLGKRIANEFFQLSIPCRGSRLFATRTDPLHQIGPPPGSHFAR